MRYFILLIALIINGICLAQQEFHVFPIDGSPVKGSPSGNGSLERPWDLQTALSQSSERINGGDIIWLHKGIYKGRFISTLQSTIENEYITVTAFKNEKVIIDGNEVSNKGFVLSIKGDKVIYKNFEVTFLGEFSRIKGQKGFKNLIGINHVRGVDCKFQNITVCNIPGTGFGSWKATGGTVIEDCLIYNNGYLGSRGHGVGIYVQNESDKIRLIKNNIIFSNYYKGVEIWSSTHGTNREFVKNVELKDNVIFNNGLPSGKAWSNLIIASGDSKGINIAKNIKVKDNIFYHNTDFTDYKNYGYGNSITIGYTPNALVQDLVIEDNVIIGRNNAFNLLHAKSLVFQNNTVYSGYVHFQKSSLKGLQDQSIQFFNNDFYTRNLNGFRILKYKDFSMSKMKDIFKLNEGNQWHQLKNFKIQQVLKLSELKSKPNHFNVALLELNAKDVLVDFSNYEIKPGTPYEIYDVENRNVMLATGKLNETKKIKFKMELSDFDKPLHNSVSTKSNNNFNVFRIVFKH